MECLYDVREHPRNVFCIFASVSLIWSVFLFFPTGYDVCGALNLTKDSSYSIARSFLYFILFLFLGGSNRVLHAHNTFSRKT